MNKLSFIALFTLSFSLCAESSQPEGYFTPLLNDNNQSIVNHYSNELELLDSKIVFDRSSEYPTHIVRVTGDLHHLQIDCEEVTSKIDSLYRSKISSNQFFYNTYVFCGYDPKTNYATHYMINSYFDPRTDKAIEYTKQYIEKYNGTDLFGTPMMIEEAKGVIVSLSINAGRKMDNSQALLRYNHDNSNYYFASNYDVLRDLVSDIRARFFSNDPEIVLPFLQKWIFEYADKVYQPILKRSNYVELQPEKIFLMDKEPLIFSSVLKFYFAHNCNKYANKRCL